MKSTECGTTMNKKGEGIRPLVHAESARKTLSAIQRAVFKAYLRADDYDRAQIRFQNGDMDFKTLMAEHEASNPDNAGLFG
jgi:hypothetical protein